MAPIATQLINLMKMKIKKAQKNMVFSIPT